MVRPRTWTVLVAPALSQHTHKASYSPRFAFGIFLLASFPSHCLLPLSFDVDRSRRFTRTLDRTCTMVADTTSFARDAMDARRCTCTSFFFPSSPCPPIVPRSYCRVALVGFSSTLSALNRRMESRARESAIRTPVPTHKLSCRARQQSQTEARTARHSSVGSSSPLGLTASVLLFG